MAPTSFKTKNNLENVAAFLKNDIHWEAFRSSQQKYSKEIKKSKCKSWRRFCESIESAPEASRLHRILSLDHRPQLGCLKLPTGNVTEKATDTLEHLLEVHFPGFDHNIQPCRPKPREYNPRNWRLAAEAWGGTRVVFIPKFVRNDHIAAKDFKPISLTFCVLKTLERLVDRYLKIGPLLAHPLSPAQYAYREGRSTDTVLHHFVGEVEVQLETKGYALSVFLDIKGAFDSTSYDVIREAITGHHIPSALADWTQSMLTGRTLIANHRDSSVHGFPAKGCPQGGVLSLLLWCLFADELLRKLQKKGFLVFGYADDVAIIVRGSFLSTLKDTMQKALMILQNWCQSKGLRANPLKTKAMIFTRKYKPKAIEPLRLWREDIEYVQSVKYLGVHLDTKLNWKAYLDIKRSKFYVSYWACRRAMGNPGGCGRYYEKTTPTEALEVALCIPPLRLTVISAAKLTAYRLRCVGEWRDFGVGHTRLKIQPGTHAWFTDGSGANGCYGAGSYCPGSNHREFFSLGKLATVFQAEVLAILECARFLLARETKTRRINIYTDSKAAIGALAKTITESLVVWDCMQALNRLGKRNDITLVWVLGHQGIQGNKVADSLANLGTLKEPVRQIVKVPFATRKNHIKDWLKREHRIFWEILKSCRQAKALMTQPLPGHWTFKAHLFNLGLVEESSCRFCGEEREDSVHILCRCPSLALKRFRFLGSMLVEPEDLKIIKIGHLCSLANAGFQQLGRLTINGSRRGS
ncbi:uncharacterized protein LOC109861283 [Pseudomyrmex gracilis]|uniref:uncharacterized protein LOC109861283 n=1 Tax=Pseudomyrmex gracilis TaxID=219809 RepID=UPI000995AD29|nr:uncharacterized protein LOC109861283 [Pseudomyrmex gracilis]